MYQELETGNGKHLIVTKDAPIFPLDKNQIERFAKEAGFTKFNFYGSLKHEVFTQKSDELIVVIS